MATYIFVYITSFTSLKYETSQFGKSLWFHGTDLGLPIGLVSPVLYNITKKKSERNKLIIDPSQ